MNAKIRKRKQIKKPIEKSLVQKLKRITIGYGNLRTFSDAANLNYNTISAVISSGKSTEDTRVKIENALKSFA